MASPSTFLTLTLFLFSLYVDAKDVIIPEDGYTVTTVFDGHKAHIYPYTILQQPYSSQLILLDSVNSTFYTAQFPIFKAESVFTRFYGDGSVGYVDGDVGSARFDKPKSFAFDFRGNVYVADKANHAIRKISAEGVTTIAGGTFSEKSSRKDGPALNASFSNDFDLTFIPGLCALLVSDHMHQLVHQINLKEEDCTHGSKSGLGAVMTWTLLGLSCLLGLLIGFAVRHYISPNEGTNHCHFMETWKHYLTNLRKLLPTHFFVIKNAVASCSCSSVYTILMRLWNLCVSHLVLMFRINLVSPRPYLESVSLLDLDACNSGEVTRSSKYHDQLKDLMRFDEDDMDSSKATFNQRYYDSKIRSAVSLSHEAEANMAFVEAPKANVLHQESSVCNMRIVKRR